MHRPAFIGLAAITLGSSYADTLEISGGGQVTGKLTRRGDAAIVKVDDDLQVAIRASRARRATSTADYEKYKAMAAKAGNDAEMHYLLGIACMKNDLIPADKALYKLYHMRRAVELDPDHERARAQLGYTRLDGQWVLTSKLMRDRGMIIKAGRWEVPESMALEDAQDASNTEAKRWIKEVGRLVRVVTKNRKSARDQAKAVEAMQELEAIDDPLAASAIKRQFEESRGGTHSPKLRQLWIRLLARFKNSVSVQALTMAGFEDEDESIRQMALERLVEYGSVSATNYYLQKLRSNDNRDVNRAARALSWFPDSELAMEYVNALVTEHKYVKGPGPGTQAMFGGGSNVGGDSFSTGSKAKVITRTKTNPAVLSLLKQIEEGVDFGYDEKAWKHHFARKRSGFEGDLRRDR